MHFLNLNVHIARKKNENKTGTQSCKFILISERKHKQVNTKMINPQNTLSKIIIHQIVILIFNSCFQYETIQLV